MRKNIKAITKAFDKWLKDGGYYKASEYYPASVHSSTLIYDFVTDHPDFGQYEQALTRHAENIGWVSDYDDGQDEEEETDAGRDEDGWN